MKSGHSSYAELSPTLNIAPEEPDHIHLMGICGTGMSSLAGILKDSGYHITGSDQNIYPPMSDFLKDLSIQVLEGYAAENLHPIPDLVIVGNVITKHNPEAIELARLNTPYLSLPQALRHFAMDSKKSIVPCGTHGKTTTAALTAWILEKAGMSPGFMIGGIPNNFRGNFRLGNGPFFVVEGDEYDTAFFDKGPKFLHYNPLITILTGIEFDHADIYQNLDHVIESFRKLIRVIPPGGLLIANGDDPVSKNQLNDAKCPVITYGFSQGSQWKAVDILFEEDQTQFTVLKNDRKYMTGSTPLYGRHNISNLLSTIVLSDFLGIDKPVLYEAMKTFKGVKRRQEIKGKKRGILVLDDFAHHPTAVKETIRAVKEKHKTRRLIAVFEPRSNSSRRDIFQEKYALSFDMADLILIPEPPLIAKIPSNERFSSRKLVEDLRDRDLEAFYCPDSDGLLDQIIRRSQEGDVVLIMSNGPFDNLPQRVVDAL
ncbi:MAG: UDP-N-acetylmuramate:L-alanyl-gamma-D-glutamyl-meso-diaminopimelate ligase [Deltaproteobacteria bacterium]|nr:UDP-N-acetylmuramate:L-alanyl-gamma-D-glutamyl-meso-diaminopimelate ligase [Deltaproteobacteria bacterium]